jgi:hypothetical protein
VRSLQAASARNLRVYRTAAGEPVQVAISPLYGETPANIAAGQAFVNFLASRLHGSEISRVRVFLAPPQQVAAICGAGAVGCYAPGPQILVTPGSDVPGAQYSKEYVVTHEYGHHVARNRSNHPWFAGSWGPKVWASTHGVCELVAARRVAPGDQGAGYQHNPGENWAEAYAHYHFPGRPWTFSPLFRPFGATRGAVRADVLNPWRRSRNLVHSGYLSSGRSFARTISSPLDGAGRISLVGPSGANFQVEVRVRGRVTVRSVGPGSREVIRGYICGDNRFVVRVWSAGGSGRFRLYTTVP